MAADFSMSSLSLLGSSAASRVLLLTLELNGLFTDLNHELAQCLLVSQVAPPLLAQLWLR